MSQEYKLLEIETTPALSMKEKHTAKEREDIENRVNNLLKEGYELINITTRIIKHQNFMGRNSDFLYTNVLQYHFIHK